MVSKVISGVYKSFKACVQILSYFQRRCWILHNTFLELPIFLRGEKVYDDVYTVSPIRTILLKRKELLHHILFSVNLVQTQNFSQRKKYGKKKSKDIHRTAQLFILDQRKVLPKNDLRYRSCIREDLG